MESFLCKFSKPPNTHKVVGIAPTLYISQAIRLSDLFSVDSISYSPTGGIVVRKCANIVTIFFNYAELNLEANVSKIAFTLREGYRPKNYAYGLLGVTGGYKGSYIVGATGEVRLTTNSTLRYVDATITYVI